MSGTQGAEGGYIRSGPAILSPSELPSIITAAPKNSMSLKCDPALPAGLHSKSSRSSSLWQRSKTDSRWADFA